MAKKKGNFDGKKKTQGKGSSLYKKGDVLTVRIEDIGNDGEGIGKVEGYTLFVKDAVIGDLAKVSIMKSKKNYAYAHLDEVLEKSPGRINPPCPVSKACGGCQIQNMSYENQLRFKENKVRNNIIRLGNFDADFVDEVMEPIIGMEGEPFQETGNFGSKELKIENSTDKVLKDQNSGNREFKAQNSINRELKVQNSAKDGVNESSTLTNSTFRYRNKAQFPIGTGKDKNPIAGFYAGRTHAIIPVEDCLLGVSENKEILKMVLDHMKKYKIPAYDEQTGKGVFRHVLIRKGFRSGELMVCLVVNSKGSGEFFKGQDELTSNLSKISGIKSITLNINKERTNVILGNEIHTLWGEDTIEDTLCGIKFRISPLSFYQVNPIQTEKLYNTAVNYAGLSGNETVWDLYCGIGTISLSMAKKAKHVYGVEVISQAIDNAKENAENNNIENATFYVGKAEEVLPDFYNNNRGGESALHPDVIVVDPPRKGCDSACLETMLKMSPDRIVYVSCDSATLARDLRILCDGGYEIKHITPVDMFPHTVHVETVVLLTKVSGENA